MRSDIAELSEFLANRRCNACGSAIPEDRPLHAKYCDDPGCRRLRSRLYQKRYSQDRRERKHDKQP